MSLSVVCRCLDTAGCLSWAPSLFLGACLYEHCKIPLEKEVEVSVSRFFGITSVNAHGMQMTLRPPELYIMSYMYSLRGNSEHRGLCEIVTWPCVGHRDYRPRFKSAHV